tara:strand:+ start:739 stop:924 length:186 start_codon:yes stop_codon:yes gene_type:complete
MATRVTIHTKLLASHIIQEGMGNESNRLLELANFEWEIETNRPYTYEDYVEACAWINGRLA